MSRPAALALGATALALAGVLRWQSQEDARPEPPPISRIEARAENAASPAAADRVAQVAGIMARPLFEPGRRPAANAPVAAPAPAVRTVPRVTGVLVSAADRSAIFAAPGASAATVAREGGRVGEYTVQRIAAGQVTLMGPEGPLMLRPAFDRNRPSPAQPPAPAPVPPPPVPRPDDPQ